MKKKKTIKNETHTDRREKEQTTQEYEIDPMDINDKVSYVMLLYPYTGNNAVIMMVDIVVHSLKEDKRECGQHAH